MQVDTYQMIKIPRIASSKKESHKARGFKIQVTTGDVVKRIYKALNMGCAYCGCDLNIDDLAPGQHSPDNYLTLDIVNPSNRVLSNDNMAFICKRCNQMKSNMDLDDFLWHCSLISEGLLIGGK